MIIYTGHKADLMAEWLGRITNWIDVVKIDDQHVGSNPTRVRLFLFFWGGAKSKANLVPLLFKNW